MNKKSEDLRHLIFLATCITLSLVTKRFISPITNILTDFLRIPGGGAAAAFSLMFLIVGTYNFRWRWAATYAGFAQGVIALCLGMSSYQGLFALLTYTAPCVVIDLFRMFYPNKDSNYFCLACAAANMAGALLTNLLVFRLRSLAFVLWMLVSCIFGLLGGMIGSELSKRIESIPKFKKKTICQKK